MSIFERIKRDYLIWYTLKSGFWAGLKLAITIILTHLRVEPRTVIISYRGCHFPIVINDGSDLGVLHEVFVIEQYKLNDTAKEPKLIFDLGANVGYTILYFRSIFPTARIIAVEALPQTVLKLQKNIADQDNIEVVAKAVTDRSGSVTFYDYPASSMSSSMVRRHDQANSYQVPAITLNDLVTTYGPPDLIKIDIEGAEYQVLNNFDNLNRVPQIIGEVHPDIGNFTETDFLRLFTDFTVTKRFQSATRFMFAATKVTQD